MWICPQNSKIFRLISCLNPAIKAVAAIITATLSATAAMAIRMMSREKFFPPENAMRRAIKKGRFKIGIGYQLLVAGGDRKTGLCSAAFLSSDCCGKCKAYCFVWNNPCQNLPTFHSGFNFASCFGNFYFQNKILPSSPLLRASAAGG